VGEWRSTGGGARLTTAENLGNGFSAPVVARFSMPSGNPQASDTAVGVRGLALAIPLAEAQAHQFVMVSAPMFIVRTPAAFAASLASVVADPMTGRVDPARIAAFNAAHPEAEAMTDWLSANPPSNSYATAPYFGVHTFFLLDAAGTRTPVRWRFEPVAGYQGLTPEQRQSFSRDFLEPELRERLARGPAEWRVFIAIGEPGDTLDDPTQTWPAERRQIEVARLRITGVGGNCDPLMFNPLVLPAGMAPSDDPVLLVRGPAYEVSLDRRQP
jgi:catalase